MTMTDLQGEKKTKNLKFHNFLRFQFLKLRLLQIKRLDNFTVIWSLESFSNGHTAENEGVMQFGVKWRQVAASDVKWRA